MARLALENSAAEAPSRGFTHSPTGFPRMTPGLLKVDRSAESFAGLPEGIESPGRLLAALKAAAPRLGISPRLVHAVDWLFCFTHPQDWKPGARPLVWPSASMQQQALGLSPTQVKEINRRLIELGLVTMKDSPNGKRYGKRDPKGRIIEAYGFDLSPVAARYAEFVRLAEEGRAERAAMGRLRRRATIARKGIIQILETAREFVPHVGCRWPPGRCAWRRGYCGSCGAPSSRLHNDAGLLDLAADELALNDHSAPIGAVLGDRCDGLAQRLRIESGGQHAAADSDGYWHGRRAVRHPEGTDWARVDDQGHLYGLGGQVQCGGSVASICQCHGPFWWRSSGVLRHRRGVRPRGLAALPALD